MSSNAVKMEERVWLKEKNKNTNLFKSAKHKEAPLMGCFFAFKASYVQPNWIFSQNHLSSLIFDGRSLYWWGFRAWQMLCDRYFSSVICKRLRDAVLYGLIDCNQASDHLLCLKFNLIGSGNDSYIFGRQFIYLWQTVHISLMNDSYIFQF